MTDLIPQVDSQVDLDAILRKLTDQKQSRKAPERPAKPLNTVEVKDTSLAALEVVSELLRATEVPSDRKELTPTQLQEIATLVDVAKRGKTALVKIEDVVKRAVFAHFDRLLEAEQGVDVNEADAPWNEKWETYAVKDEVYVPGANVRLTREVTENAPQVLAEDVRTLFEAGVISEQVFNAVVKKVEVEVIDGGALFEIMSENLDLAEKLSGAITPGNLTPTFHVRPPLKGQ